MVGCAGAALEEIDDQPAGYVRLCFNPDFSECGIYFSHEEPLESFNTSGYGKLELASKDAKRLAGTWILAEPEDFFDKTYQFDLTFDAEVIATAVVETGRQDRNRLSGLAEQCDRARRPVPL